MAKQVDEVIDSQFLAENVGFLENCFDNSFVLQTSIVAVKEYSTEYNDSKLSKKPGICSQNKTVAFESSICKSSQPVVSLTSNEKSKELKCWGLPHEIAKKYKSRGITEMFDWQVSCLGNPKVLLDCCNLVYSAPTSAGKTLVAELLTIKTVLERQKKVIVILPFVSIVREKMFYLQEILSTSGIRVEGFMGSQSPPGGMQAVHVAICTIEKANSLINRLLDEGTISDLGAVIVDEMHLLGDPHRGYILELLLTKVKYVTSKLDDVHIQIVGMSATLPNLDVLANWLNAELFITQFRPIPLEEYCLVGTKYYDKNGDYVNTIQNVDTTLGSDNVLRICFETIEEGCSVLIFCMTKNRCESLAQNISSSFYKLGCSPSKMGTVLRAQLKTDSILEVLEQLKNCPVGLDNVLKNCISFGVAYHHAGLTFDERDIIEGAFKSGAIRVLVATSTLSSGVNLPARKVIIRTPVFQRQPINILTYKQMIGRAGRMGKDVKGESILICTDQEKNIGFNLMMGVLEPVTSCIESEDKFLRAVLEMIASGVACTIEELELYSQCTLLFTQKDESLFKETLLNKTLEELKNYELIREQHDDEFKRYIATSLGKACLSSSIAPNDGLSLFCELQRARQCVVLETDLHLIYLVTPYSVSSQWGDIDWLHLLTMWESLTKAMKKVGELVGVQESFIIRCVRGTNKMDKAQSRMNIHKRFYTALALQDLVNEVPLPEVAVKFQCARGFLQSLQQAAATFAGMVTVFCHQLGWKNMELLIAQFRDRLHFGIHSELLELMKLPSLNGMRARSLFDAGYETVTNVASGDINAIENALVKAVPFQSEKQRDDDDKSDIRKRNKIKSVWITGCCGMTTREAAEKLIIEARQYVEREIGVDGIKWNKDDNKIETKSAECSIVKHQLINNKNELAPPNETVESKITDEKLTSGPIMSKRDDTFEFERNECVNLICNPHESGIILEEHYEGNMQSKDKCIDVSSQNQDEILEQDSKNTKEFIEKALKNAEKNKSSVITDCHNKNKSDSLTSADDIAWDTLNINETVFNMQSKNRLSDKLFSPDISFSDGEVKCENDKTNMIPKSISNSTCKDISLFSSDGDNSSLFEDSLPLELLPSRLLNADDETNKSIKIENVTVNTNSILQAFQSTIENIEEDENIKLVYDDDKAVGCTPGSSSSPIGSAVDQKCTANIIGNIQSPYKRSISDADSENFIDSPVVKKIKVEKVSQPENNYGKSNIPLITSSSSALSTMDVGVQRLKCYLLKENDILLNLQMLQRLNTDVSLTVEIDKCKTVPSTEIIGRKVLKQINSELNTSTERIKGGIRRLAVYFGTDVVLYFDLTQNERSASVFTEVSKWLCKSDLKLRLLSSKFTYLALRKHFDIELSSLCFDVSLAEWLVNSDEKEPSLNFLMNKYCKLDLSSIRNKNLRDDVCVKTWAVWKVAEEQKALFQGHCHNIQRVLDIEVHVSRILAMCEYYGLTVDKSLTSQLLIDVKDSQEIIKKKAYQMCGHHFNFNSSRDVAKILGIFRGRKVSTKKSVLTTHNSPISSTIIFWRKLNSILTKTLYPLTEKALIYSEGDRVNPSYTMYTCSGRICMHEPNLQNVPRTFSIPASYLQNEDSDDIIEFNCRNIFKATPGYVLVSADYCQLEMRILTHYCGDAVLTRIMSSDVDVFKSIAASWGSVSEDEVDDDLRQKAKQLCYGIIYGMGNRTLGQMLDVSEMEAAVFMDTFHRTYPSIKVFTSSLIEECQLKGYVETLMKRRRPIPDINSGVASKRSSAARQAVNTTIQGSAADVAKAAMCEIDNRTRELYQNNKPRLILQMHDELIYEVPQAIKHDFIALLKHVMENTIRLNVPLPVKVKSGLTWGTLTELKL